MQIKDEVGIFETAFGVAERAQSVARPIFGGFRDGGGSVGRNAGIDSDWQERKCLARIDLCRGVARVMNGGYAGATGESQERSRNNQFGNGIHMSGCSGTIS